MSETPPDDIRDAARAVVQRGYDTGLFNAVMSALLAERERATAAENERCAKIAEDAGWLADPMVDKLGWPRAIAAAIRRQPDV